MTGYTVGSAVFAPYPPGKVDALNEIAKRVAAAPPWSDTAPRKILAAGDKATGYASSSRYKWRYEVLWNILDDAYDHAALGKGKERHARDLPFEQQPMLETTRLVGPGFPLGQAIKKAGEASGMIERGEFDAAEAECLGAINYLAGAVAWVREQRLKVSKDISAAA